MLLWFALGDDHRLTVYRIVLAHLAHVLTRFDVVVVRLFVAILSHSTINSILDTVATLLIFIALEPNASCIMVDRGIVKPIVCIESITTSVER